MVVQNMTKAEILAWLVKENKLHSFDDIDELGELDGCKIYGFSTKNREPLYVGLPNLVIVKNNQPEIMFGEKDFEILDKLSSK